MENICPDAIPDTTPTSFYKSNHQMTNDALSGRDTVCSLAPERIHRLHTVTALNILVIL